MKYPGGKNASGTYQKIINQIPPHDIYIELFLGSGAILRLKRPAETSIGVEIDPDVFHSWEERVEYSGIVTHCDALAWLEAWRCAWPDKRVMVYADPPWMDADQSHYRYKFGKNEHIVLLDMFNYLPSNWMVALSGYRSDLYDLMLKRWRRIDWNVVTRSGGTATESLWMNYPEPYELHDYQYLGDDYREREKIHKQQRRWERRMVEMPALQRYAMMSVIERHKAGGVR